MSIDRLRYFVAVVETKNLRKAAELVGIAPPSMSKAIAVLEEELGFKLLFPEGRGIGITSKGLDVYRSSASLLTEHRKFFERLRNSSESNDQIRLATFEIFSTYFVSSFLQIEKNLELMLLEKTPGQIEASILSGEVSLGITYIPSPQNALEYREIGSFAHGIYGHKKWNDVPFAEWPFAIPTTELRIHASDIDSLDMWPNSAPSRKIKYKLELLETALQTARCGQSVLHIPDFLATLQNEQVRTSYQLVKLPFPKGYKEIKPTKVYLVGRKGEIPSSLERKLAKFMRSLSK